MSNRIITIGRQFGSNGRFIGIALAERLGIHCYDRDLIKLASEHTDIPYEQLKLVDEKREKPWRYQVDEDNSMDRHYRYGHIDEILFNLQSKIIKQLAEKEDCILVGRCANYVLREEKRCKNVYLYAPLDVRIETVMKRYNLDEKGAHSLVRKVDKDRAYYYNYYTDQSWDEMETYDLSLDTNVFTVDETVDILEMVYNKL